MPTRDDEMAGQATVAGLDRARQLAAQETRLAVVVTSRPDGSQQVSVVNAGVLDHPRSGDPVVGFVARGGVGKLSNLRSHRRATVVFRSGWDWVAVEGDADLAGPDDALEGLDPTDVPCLLRRVYAAAIGGTEDDWTQLDDVMGEDRHTAVFVRPLRVYSNPPRKDPRPRSTNRSITSRTRR